jgi:hypothetical protein
LTLIKSTLSNLSMFYYRIPVGVANRLERLERYFNGVVMEMSLNLVNWARICTLIKSGGL